MAVSNCPAMKMFKPMAFTIAFALLGSIFAALIMAPALSSLLLKVREQNEFIVTRLLKSAYRPLLSLAVGDAAAGDSRPAPCKGHHLPEGAYLVYDFWEQAFLGECRDGVPLRLRPCASRVLAIPSSSPGCGASPRSRHPRK